MRRRLHILFVLATAIVGVGLAVGGARADDPAATRREVDLPPPPSEVADPAEPPAPAELPPDFLDAKPATPKPAPEPTAPAKPAGGKKSAPPLLKNLFGGAAQPEKAATTDRLDEPPPELPPVKALPKPQAMAPPPSAALPAPADPEVERVQAAPAAASAPNPAGLPPAVEPPPGQPAPSAAAGVPPEQETPFYITPDKLPVGRQGVGLSVEVVGPQFLNVNQTAPLKIIVKNTGTTDARGVVVRDVLPPNLKYESSQPEVMLKGEVLTWNLGDVPAGSERLITLRVTPTAVGGFDHAATVTMAAGARSRTTVREPKLKVELQVDSGKVLKGQPVTFRIAVTNPGDGPAKNVSVKAALSPGLRHESGEPNEQNVYEQSIDHIAAGETVTLDPLVADTILGGEQWCKAIAKSPDVVAGAPTAESAIKVFVIEPRLTVKIAGPPTRFTDTLASYEVVLENPGTAPARNVKVVTTVPVTARLQNPLPTGATFNPQTRKLTCGRAQIDAGEKVALPFTVRVGGASLYSFSAEAKADTVPLAKDVFQTNVEGLAVVDFEVTEHRHVVDVDGTTTFVIRIVNSGTKEANNLLVNAEVSPNVKIEKTGGTEEQAKSPPNDLSKVVFPVIPRLVLNKTLELGVKVTVLQPGIATCRVYITHDDGEKLDENTSFKIVPSRK